MKRRDAVLAAGIILVSAVVGYSWTSVISGAYNSEEHKLLGDRGAAAVTIPASVKLPEQVTFKPISAADYVAGMKAAKGLSVGYETNAEDGWNTSKEAIQDNCYFTTWFEATNTFKQADYNIKLWIPAPATAPANVLRLTGKTNNSAPHVFTIGELVAFYGDYRQIPYCDGTDCYVTNGNISEVRFVAQGSTSHSLFPTREKFCPAAMNAGTYIARIGSGLVPPFGKAGNATRNTAKGIGDYWDAGWWGDEMLRIAKVNDWHFSNVAVAWYVGMHRLALLYADSARVKPDYWVRALHYEANALHSLTDLFAFGHVVTNSDSASHAIIVEAGWQGKTVYRWMENVIEMGGGKRNGHGLVDLGATLPAIADRPGTRDVFQPSDGSTASGLRKVGEMIFHDKFNHTGATVKNLRGDVFMIFGDGKLRNMLDSKEGMRPGADVAVSAVTASIQSLFDAYDQLARGASTVEQLGATGSAYFSALQYLPVYIESAHGYFAGQYAAYAQTANEISGAGKTLPSWPACKIPFLSGNTVPPAAAAAAAAGTAAGIEQAEKLIDWPKRTAKCAEF